MEAEVPGKQLSFDQKGKPIPGNVLRVGGANARDVVDWMTKVRDHERVTYERGEEGEPGSAVYAAATSLFGADDRTRGIKVPVPDGARAFEVVGIPLKQPGFYVVELASPKLGEALLAGADPAAKASRCITSRLPRWSPTSQCISSRDENRRSCG